MDPLYKIVKQLSEEEFGDIYENLTSNKAEKSALFLKTIRESDNPVEDFLEKQDISASAFYVLKSRLNQKVENFLLNRLGDPKMEAIHKVFKVYDLIFNSPREIALTTLRRLEKTMIDMDNPLVLMIVYRAQRMLQNYDAKERTELTDRYNEAVAFYLATEKANEYVLNFFRTWDRYFLGRRDKDFQELIKIIEKVNNINNLYDSQRLYICKSVIHLFSQQFLELPERVLGIMDNQEESFEKCFQILEKSKEDIHFKNINLIFDYLRFCYYSNNGKETQARIYFELLDYKVDELLRNFNFAMDCSGILFFKLQRHIQEGTIRNLLSDHEDYISHIEVDSYRLVTYVNFHMFQAYVAYYSKNYDTAARILYRMRNKVNLRKFPHMDAEVKLFLAFAYVLQDEVDLANQLILSLQRQVKKAHFREYPNAKVFLKILTNRLSSKSSKRVQLVRKYQEEFNELNKGKYAILTYLDLEFSLFGAE